MNNYEKTVYFALTYSTAKTEPELEEKAAAVAEPEPKEEEPVADTRTEAV